MFSFLSALTGVGIPLIQKFSSVFHFLDEDHTFDVLEMKWWVLLFSSSREGNSLPTELHALWPLGPSRKGPACSWKHQWSSESEVVPSLHWLYDCLYASDPIVYWKASSCLCWPSRFRSRSRFISSGTLSIKGKEWICLTCPISIRHPYLWAKLKAKGSVYKAQKQEGNRHAEGLPERALQVSSLGIQPPLQEKLHSESQTPVFLITESEQDEHCFTTLKFYNQCRAVLGFYKYWDYGEWQLITRGNTGLQGELVSLQNTGCLDPIHRWCRSDTVPEPNPQVHTPFLMDDCFAFNLVTWWLSCLLELPSVALTLNP